MWKELQKSIIILSVSLPILVSKKTLNYHTVHCIMNCLHDCEDWPCFRGDDLVDMRVGNSTSEDGCDGRNGDF